MSSVAIQGNAAGVGVFTIASPNSASSYTLTLPTSTGTLIAGTGTANVGIPAGTATVAPLLFTSGTNLTSATAGAMEYDGKVIYATPQGTQRGVVPGVQFFRLNADLAGANVTTAQSILGVGVTLSASTVYAFEMVAAFSKTAGATSHAFQIGFGGTATLNSIAYDVLLNSSATSFAQFNSVNGSNGFIQTASATTLTTNASAPLYHSIFYAGVVSINAGGTFIPQYTLSVAPGGAYTTTTNSYMKIYPVGASGANTSVGTWA